MVSFWELCCVRLISCRALLFMKISRSFNKRAKNIVKDCLPASLPYYIQRVEITFFYPFFLTFLQDITLITQVQSYTTIKIQNREKNTTKINNKKQELTLKPDPGSNNMLM